MPSKGLLIRGCFHHEDRTTKVSEKIWDCCKLRQGWCYNSPERELPCQVCSGLTQAIRRAELEWYRKNGAGIKDAMWEGLLYAYDVGVMERERRKREREQGVVI